MEWLVKHMMMWSGVTEKELFEKQEIQTDIDVLCWDYYRYILSHPIENGTVRPLYFMAAKIIYSRSAL